MKKKIKDTIVIVMLAIACAILIYIMMPMNEAIMLAYAGASAGIDLVLSLVIGAGLMWFFLFLINHDVKIPTWIPPEAVLIIPAITLIILWYFDLLPFTNIIFPYNSERVFQIILGG